MVDSFNRKTSNWLLFSIMSRVGKYTAAEDILENKWVKHNMIWIFQEIIQKIDNNQKATQTSMGVYLVLMFLFLCPMLITDLPWSRSRSIFFIAGPHSLKMIAIIFPIICVGHPGVKIEAIINTITLFIFPLNSSLISLIAVPSNCCIFLMVIHTPSSNAKMNVIAIIGEWDKK